MQEHFACLRGGALFFFWTLNSLISKTQEFCPKDLGTRHRALDSRHSQYPTSCWVCPY